MPEPLPAESTARSRWLEWALIAGLILASLGARYYFGPTASRVIPGTLGQPLSERSSEPPSMDELWHLALTTGWGDYLGQLPNDQHIKDMPALTSLDQARPWWTVWTSLEYVIHPPLYVTSLRLWRNAFGGSDVAAIAYSALWSAVAVGMAYAVARTVAGKTAAFWAGLILALSPTQIYFGLEIRGYAMVVAIVSTLLYVLVRIQRDGASRSRCWMLGGVLLASLLTHYLTLTTCALVGLLSLIYARHGERRRVLLAGAGAGIVYSGIWLPFFLRQMKHVYDVENSFIGLSGFTRWDVFEAGLLIPLRLMREGWQQGAITTVIGAVLLIAPLLISIRIKPLRPIAIIAFIVPCIMLAQDAWNQTRLVMFIRYCAAMSPAIVIAIVCGFTLMLPARLRWLTHLLGIAAIAVGFSYDAAHFPIRNDSPSFASVAQTVAPAIRDRQPIALHLRPGLGEPWWLALELSHVPGFFPRDVILMTRPLDSKTLEQISTTEIWLLELGPMSSDDLVPGSTVLQAYRSNDGSLYRLALKK